MSHDIQIFCRFINVNIYLIFLFQPKDSTRNERMGRVPGVSTEAGQWVYGDPEMFGVHSAVAEGDGISSRLHCGPRVRSRSKGQHALYDITAKKGQADCVL